MIKEPLYKSPPTFRDYDLFTIGESYTIGWNDAMNYIFGSDQEFEPFAQDTNVPDKEE